MKILVAVKRVIDYNVQVRVKEDGTGVHTDNVKMATNPPDDNAVEEAVKIKESGKAKEVVAVTIGEEKAQETVRKALAVGADRGIHIKTDSYLEPLGVAKILKKIVEKNEKNKISLATLYNTVHAFRKNGYLKEISLKGNKTFFDTNTKSHHHFYDEDTGKLLDIKNEDIKVSKVSRIPNGKKIREIEVTVRIASDNHNQKINN